MKPYSASTPRLTTTLYHGDCLDVMAALPDRSIDMVLCDLPYGTTACSWDVVIPFDQLWSAYRRVLTPTGTVVLTASQPFATIVVQSNIDWFKYELIWVKSRATGHVHAKNKPMKKHENILVFSPGTTVHASQSTSRMTYNPQGLVRKAVPTIRKNGGAANTVMAARPSHRDAVQEFEGYPNSILEFASEGSTVHPTQKPVALFEYLIRTYSNEGDTVLDNTMGSGTTGVACQNAGRNFIGIEKDAAYFAIAESRLGLSRTAQYEGHNAVPHLQRRDARLNAT